MDDRPDTACHDHACGHCEPAAPAAPVIVPPGAALFRIANMDCSAEEAEIRRALEPVSGIRSLGFQLGARTLAIHATPEALPRAIDAITRAGFKPELLEAQSSHGGHVEHARGMGTGIVRLGFALGLALAAEAIEFLGPGIRTLELLGMALALGAIGLAGLDTYAKGFQALRHGKLNINALMAVAVTGAFLIGQWPEAAMVMALYAIAELIEARSVDRARNAIQSLMALAPPEATVRQPDGSWAAQPAADIPLGAMLRIRPGERVPLDGEIVRGQSAIDQAPVTGESIPVDKVAGDAVFAGTINQTAELEVRSTAAASDSTIARIIHAVEQAQGSRAPTQRFVDRFAAVYTPTVFVLALAVAVATPSLMGWTWTQSLYKALVLLVIACPCALVISTPVSVVSALAAAARRGILVKGGNYLEDARRLRVVALDKTGTVTEGRPELVDQLVLHTSQDTHAVAASLAQRSDHPVAQAIAQGLPAAALPVEGVKALAGRGVEGAVAGEPHVLGNHRLIEERGQCSPQLEAEMQRHEAAGRTVTLLASQQRVLALFAVADRLKPSSKAAIAELRTMGVTPVLLTGDNDATAQSIAREAGIAEARGNLLPEHKLQAIEALRARGGLVAMAGDGINDAPALARADIGIAMGGAGTDTAMEAADVVIMNDDLRRIPELIRLSQRTHRVLWQNITLALGIKAVFFGLAVFGSATMWMAVFADMGASLLVVANGLRLLKTRTAG